MIVRIRGVKRVRSKGRLYFYHQKTGERIKAPPNTTEFVVEVERLDRQARSTREHTEAKRGTLGGLIAGYRASPEYIRLADRTRTDYAKVFDYLASIDGIPLIQLSGSAVIKIRDRALAQKKRRFANHVLQVLGTILNGGRYVTSPRGTRPPAFQRCRVPAIWRKQIAHGATPSARSFWLRLLAGYKWRLP